MNPITRKEVFLAAAGGQDVTTPTPFTREEMFLDAIAKGGGGGGGSSGGGVLVVHDVDGTLDKTYAEIEAASNEGIVVVLREDGILYLSSAYFEHGTYYASFFGYERVGDYETDSENGYPALP